MVTNPAPDHILLKSNEIYNLFYLKTIDIFKNDFDVQEMFNQAIDLITDNLYNGDNAYLNESMFRCQNLNDANKMYLKKTYNELCSSLRQILIQLNISPILDVVTLREIYPYYFYKIIRGKVILKRL